ncbi:MAG: Holliday junction resolvase RuvX [Candidatus Woesebacteria bacterium]|nr:MAG: Holliday junction resolvase RuvX [Candidatus Woesebacteria bacterium]
MQILGLDYGDKKIGLAYASAFLAEPLMVVRFERVDELFEKIKKIVTDYKIEKIVVGVSEGASAEKSMEFGYLLKDKLNLEVNFQDETLSTEEANMLSREANVSRSRRKSLEDAYAATIILQNYLDKILK